MIMAKPQFHTAAPKRGAPPKRGALGKGPPRPCLGPALCLERGADLHIAQLMPLALTVSCFSKIQIGFTLLVPVHQGGPGKGPLNGCVLARVFSDCVIFCGATSLNYSKV